MAIEGPENEPVEVKLCLKQQHQKALAELQLLETEGIASSRRLISYQRRPSLLTRTRERGRRKRGYKKSMNRKT